jgi:saccharopine dehydrogenase (NAD+, L-lysine-forming)
LKISNTKSDSALCSRHLRGSYNDRIGCTLAPHSSWPQAPLDTLIIGLKELPVEKTPLPHTHIQFAHCYKQQGGWAEVLERFYVAEPQGTLYDLEFLQDASGRRVAAFGFHAGFTGAAVGALALAAQQDGGRLGTLKPYPNEDALVSEVKGKIAEVETNLGRPVRALVIGALGRCGRGAVDLLSRAGVTECVRTCPNAYADVGILAKTCSSGTWQRQRRAGPSRNCWTVRAPWRCSASCAQMAQTVDIFVNCIYLASKIPHFLTTDFIESAGPKRPLAVVVDVSCDTTNPHNPIPIYSINTTFDKPTVDVPLASEAPLLTVCSIDHLPTLLPREASEAFSADLLPSLLQLPERKTARVWTEAEALYKQKGQEARAALAQSS